MESVIELTLIPLVLLVVQAVKAVVPSAGQYSIAIVLFVGLGLSIVVVDFNAGWQAAAIAWLAATVQIASGASGVYSWGKKGDTVVELPDYSDET